MKQSRFVGVVAFLCVFSSLRGVEWSEPEFLLDTLIDPPVVTIANDGIAWVIVSSWNPQVFRFLDEQTGWQKVTACSCTLGTFSFGIDACFDKDDRLWVLTDDMFNVTYNRYDDGNWSGVDTVPTYPSWNDFAEITADSGGGVWVGWTTDWWFWLDGAYNRYENGHWDAPQVLTDTLERVDHVIQAMSTDAHGRVWVVWMNHGDVDKVPYESLESAYHDGSDWSEEILICPLREKLGDEGVLPMHGDLDLAPDSEGGVWALWSCAYNDVFSILVSYWNGESWSSVDTIAEAGDLFEASTPMGKIAVDEYGNVWAVWRQALEDNDKYGDIYYSVNSGSGWSEPVPVDTHPAADQYPDIAVDGAGRVWCVWASNREGEDEWDYSIWASYTTSAGVAEPAPAAHYPSFTIDKSVGGSFTFRVSSPDIREELLIYDAGGRVVRRLTIRSNQVIQWDGVDDGGCQLSSGVYFVRVESGTSAYTGKIVLVR